MNDIDCLFYNADILDVFDNLKYKPVVPTSIDLAAPDPSLFERAAGLPRHLPGIYSKCFPATVELHLCAVRFEFAKYLPADFDTDIHPIDNLPNILVPSEVNQFLLVVIHSSIMDRMLHLGGLKLRSLHEGLLRYRALTKNEIEYVTEHFAAVGLKKEFRRWMYICGSTFEDPQVAGKATIRLRISFFIFRQLNHRRWFILLRYNYFLMVRGLKYGLFNPTLRAKLVQASWWTHKIRLIKKAWKG